VTKKTDSFDLERVRMTSIRQKRHKVDLSLLCRPWTPGGSFTDFLDGLPGFLAARDLVDVTNRIVEAVQGRRAVLLGMGAHPIKVGLAPVLIGLMEQGVLAGLALNGAGIVHDVEMAMAGHTSEEVDVELSRGTFGMVRETHETINHAIRRGARKGFGIGEALGRTLLEGDFPYRHLSLLAAGRRLGIPVTVHVAIGTDIVHMSPSADGAAIGKGSLRDFRTFASLVARLEKGVYINLGSAVVLPEVFLKALALARNLGHRVTDLTTVNMDFIHHYRPATNVVRRPTLQSGKGFTLIGHHEIMFPLLAAAVLEKLSKKGEAARP
jgi:hypothetical protein